MEIETTDEESKILIEALDHQVDSYASPYVNEQQLKPIRNEQKQIVQQIKLFQDYTPVMREFIKKGLVKMRKYEDIDISTFSDFELFLDFDKYQSLAKRNDTFSVLFNKFKNNKDKSEYIYQPLIEKLQNLKTNYKIYLSESKGGTINKFALIGAKQHGFGYRNEKVTLDLEYEKQSPDSYTKEGSLSEVITQINDKVENGTTTQFEIQLLGVLRYLSA